MIMRVQGIRSYDYIIVNLPQYLSPVEVLVTYIRQYYLSLHTWLVAEVDHREMIWNVSLCHSLSPTSPPP